MGELTEEQRTKLLEGVEIDGELCKFDAIDDRGGEGSNHWYHVIIREGKNREVRKMMEAAGLMVSRLIRVRFGSIELPSHVQRGMLREMEEEQVQELLAFAGMNEPPPGESAEDDGETELDNIGNSAPDPSRDARRQEIHVDDDIGNRFVKGGDAAATRVEDEDIGFFGDRSFTLTLLFARALVGVAVDDFAFFADFFDLGFEFGPVVGFVAARLRLGQQEGDLGAVTAASTATCGDRDKRKQHTHRDRKSLQS